MMVIKSNSTVGTIYPADRCTWTIAADADGGYTIGNVRFYNGAAAVTTDLAGTHTFGYIGKSGRFVPISN